MAATERFTLYSTPDHSLLREEIETPMPGLRVSARTTSASLPDYPEWTMDELNSFRKNAIVTDGSCS